MKVRLTNDATVRFARDTVLEVSELEASRLISLNNAVKVEKKKAEAKPAKDKK